MPLRNKSLRDKLGEYVPLLARKPALPREQSLALKPIRNPAVRWERAMGQETTKENGAENGEEDGGAGQVVLRVPLKTGGLSRLMTRWLSMPGSKTIELDEFGGAVWEMCDGRHTVEQFIGHTCKTYQLNRRQAEVSVLAFMRMLMERRLIGFREADPLPAAHLKGKEHVGANPCPAPKRKRRQRPARRY